MSKISVYGYEGTNEELERELALGLAVLRVWDMPMVRACMSNLKKSVRVADRPSLTRSR